LNRTLKAAALTAALSAAALVSTPAIAFADQSHGRPVTLHCDSCRLPSNGGGVDRGRDDHGRDDRGGLDASHRGVVVDRGTIVDRGILSDNHRGIITDNHRGIGEDRGDHRRHSRSIVIEVSRSAGALLLHSQRSGSDFPGALRTGSSIARVRTNDNAEYRGLNRAGSVRIVVHNGRTECDAQGRLRCAVDGPSVVRIFH